MSSKCSRPIYLGNKNINGSADRIENNMESFPDGDPDLDPEDHDEDTNIASQQGIKRRQRIPKSRLHGPLVGAIGGCALLSLASGTVIIMMGALVQVLMGLYAAKQGPVLWWVGLGPFALGIWGLYAASKKNRRTIYAWGMCNILVALTQTAVMGWVGNYTMSHYDVWPLHQVRMNTSVCQMMQASCYCQDYYHGVYSSIELPGVEYLYIDDIKWRKSAFDTCGHLGVITALFGVCHATWGVSIVTSIFSCILSHAGSICAKEDTIYYDKDQEERENEDWAVPEHLHEEPEEMDGIEDGRLEVVYSEFERY